MAAPIENDIEVFQYDCNRSDRDDEKFTSKQEGSARYAHLAFTLVAEVSPKLTPSVPKCPQVLT